MSRSKKNRPKNRQAPSPRTPADDRWKKVWVWIVPLIFGIPLAVAFSSTGPRVVWAGVAAAVIGFYYLLFLVEWYVWPENPARRRARALTAIACVLVIGIGLILHYRLGVSRPTTRPRVWVQRLSLFQKSEESIPVIELIFENAGEATAVDFTNDSVFSLSTREMSENELPAVLTQDAGPKGFIPVGRSVSAHIPAETINPQAIELIGTGEKLLYVYGVLNYSDEDKNKYRTRFCGIYVPETDNFRACMFHNDIN